MDVLGQSAAVFRGRDGALGSSFGGSTVAGAGAEGREADNVGVGAEEADAAFFSPSQASSQTNEQRAIAPTEVFRIGSGR